MLYKLGFKLVLYDLKKNLTYQTKILIILMNKAMNNEKKLNCLQSLNEK